MSLTPEQRKALSQRILRGWPTCESCQRMIPLERLETLPETSRCVQHSNEGRYVGVPLFSHKTAPEVAKVKADPNADDGLGESVHQLLRGYHRRR